MKISKLKTQNSKPNAIFLFVLLILFVLFLGWKFSRGWVVTDTFSQGLAQQSSCQAREWSCLEDSADYPDVICQTCGTLCVYRIPRNPAFTWLCPTRQDLGQKDGTALVGQTHYYFDYDLGKIQIRGPLPPP